MVTLGAGIRLLSCVDFHVIHQNPWSSEGLCTFRAVIWFHATVGPLVTFQNSKQRESLVTLGLGTGKRFLSAVDCHVNP